MKKETNTERSILVVEDEETLRVLLVRAFVTRGFRIDSASNYRDGLDKISSDDYDLLVVDKNLPGGSGLDIIERSRTLGKCTEAILITGYSDTHSRTRAAELKVFRYLRKPFDLEELQIDVDRALEYGNLKKKIMTGNEKLRDAKAEFNKATKTHRKNQEQTKAAEHLATMGSLSAGIAHELSAPLSLLSMAIPYAISEAGELLAEVENNSDPSEQFSEKFARVVDTLGPTQDAVNFLIRLCGDLSCIAIEPQQVILPIRLSDALNTAMRLSKHTLPKNTEINLDVPSEIKIRGIENRLILALINLISRCAEGLKETELGHPHLTIGARATGNQVNVMLSHSGPGTSQSSVDRMFDQAFLDYQSTTEKDEPRSGLCMVRNIVEEHGGKIYATSQPGKGITYTIQFDLHSASIVPVPAVLPLSTQDSVTDRRKLLFFDTSPSNRRIYESSFGSLHEVTIANSAKEAQELIEAKADELDAIICELPTTKNLGTSTTEIQVLALAFARHHGLRERTIFLADPGADLEQAKNDGFRIVVKPARLSWLLSEIYRIPPRSAGK